MSFANLHKLVAYLLSGLGLFALSLGTELAPQVVVLMFLGYVGSYFAEGKLLSHPYYSRGWTAVLAAALAFQCLRAMSAEPTLAMPIEFAALLQISKLWNRRTAVDYQHIAVLAFVHLIAATVLSTSLSYALIFVGFVIVTPWMLALSQLRREIEGNYPASASDDEHAQAAVRRVLASRRVVGASFLFNTALLALPLFAMTLAIFVVVPRVGQGFLNLQRTHGQRVAGFGNQVELGGFGVIRDDPTVVLRVTPLPRVDEKAPRMSLRLRGTSFDHYDGRRWTRSQNQSKLLTTFDRENYTIIRNPDEQHDQRLQIVLDHLDEAVVFVPYGAVALHVPARMMQAQKVTRGLFNGPGLDIRYEDPNEMGLIYTAYVSPNPQDADIPALPSERRARYLQLPEKGNERIAALAREITVGSGSELESAQRIVRYLHSKRFKYSLTLPDTKDKPPLDVFLFEAHTGHCEYFASAMAVLLRTLGIPARNVTGFVGGRYNPYGGYYALRQGDAHSWVEAYIEGRGWVTYDPTPAMRAELGPKTNMWADLQALMDAIRTRWMTSVVGYDLRTQVSMLRQLSKLFSSNRSGNAADGGSHIDFAGLKRLGVLIVWGIVGLGVLVIAVRWYLRRRRGQPLQRAMSPQEAEAVRLYRELERALLASGYARPAGSTPLEHARALEEAGYAQAPAVRDVTESYMRVRYGGEDLGVEQRAQLREAISRVKRTHKQDAAAKP